MSSRFGSKGSSGIRVPSFVEVRGWRGGDKHTLYHFTDKKAGRSFVLPGDQSFLESVDPEAEVRPATRAEAEEMWQKPLHPVWKVA